VYGGVAVLCFIAVGLMIWRIFSPAPRDVYTGVDLIYRGVTIALFALIPGIAGFLCARRCLYWHRKAVSADQWNGHE
jgi:hypothetical protein